MLIPLTPDHVSCSMLSADCGSWVGQQKAQDRRRRRQNEPAAGWVERSSSVQPARRRLGARLDGLRVTASYPATDLSFSLCP